MGTTITLDKSEYDALQLQITQARTNEAAMRDELLAERSRPSDERIAQLTEFNVAAKEIIDYAVANLSPEFSRGWPAQAMDTVAEGVTKFGAVSERDRERAVIWRQFSEAIRDFDRRWALATMALGAPVPTPQTTEVDDDSTGERPKVEYVAPSHWAFIGAGIAFLILTVGALWLR